MPDRRAPQGVQARRIVRVWFEEVWRHREEQGDGVFCVPVHYCVEKSGSLNLVLEHSRWHYAGCDGPGHAIRL